MGTFSMIGNREQLDTIPSKVTAHISIANAGTVRYSKHLRRKIGYGTAWSLASPGS
jgi:hypothetical protein